MTSKTYIIINTQFPARHCWPDCPIPEQMHLKNPHRHVFHVKMKWRVYDDDREIEFIEMKRTVDEFINEAYWDKFLGSTSCEMLCKTLADQFDACYVRVMEDAENGAEYFIHEERKA